MGKRGYKADDGYHKAARLVRASIPCLRACARLPHTHISTLIPIRCSTAAARSALRRHGRSLANQARPRQLRCNRFAGMRGCCAKKLLNRPQRKVPACTLITPSQLVLFRHSHNTPCSRFTTIIHEPRYPSTHPLPPTQMPAHRDLRLARAAGAVLRFRQCQQAEHPRRAYT